MLKLRPHHILDIIAKYGNNIRMDPHPYGHLVHKIADQILKDVDLKVQLIIENDDICGPCIHLLPNGRCDDILHQLDTPVSKQDYNDVLDARLLNFLKLQQNQILTVREYLSIVDKRLPPINKICAHPLEDPGLRKKGLEQGLFKLGIRLKSEPTDDHDSMEFGG